jgi:RND family efflux transporter MFP subunit
VESLLYVGLSNAAVTTVLALAAALASGFLRDRPTVVHTLWVLVLLKLLTPSLIRQELSWEAPADRVITSPGPTGPPDPLSASPEASAALPATAATESPGVTVGSADVRPWPWVPALVTLWLTGAAVYWSVAGLRLYGFGRLLRAARPAPAALDERVTRVAARLGVRRPPGVWLVPARVPPMLWALSAAPRLILPAELWARLGEAEQDAVLAHELAHLRRRDHWVRWLELAALGLYWWHPAAWWARRELGKAEERCCDAWVLWALPGAAEAYAAALLDTVTFLSASRSAVPVGASGAGRVLELKRRLGMILNGSTSKAAPAVPRTVLGLGVVALLLLPVWAPGDPPDPAQPPDPPAKQSTTPSAAGKTEDPPSRAARGAEEFLGRVQPGLQVRVSPAVAGQVVNVHAEPGKLVKKGELLVELDDARCKLGVEHAAAKLQIARARMDRARTAREAGVAQDLKVAEAELKVAETDLSLARLNLEATKIVAPIDGTILALHVGVGSSVVPGANLCDLADLRSLQVVVDVPEASLAKVFREQRCVIKPLGSDTEYKGRVGAIEPVVDPTTSTCRVRVGFRRPDPDDGPRPGSAVHVRFLPKE